MKLKKTILVVDDDLAAVDKLVARLEKLYEILVAQDGVKAAYIFERHNQRIAALITKGKIPRLDGGALSDWVHHINPKLPVIILRNSIWKKPTTRTDETTHLLTQPFAPIRIEAMLREII
jgi:DNA-binding NtrC family response regulator